MGTGPYSLLLVALHQSQFLQPARHQSAHLHVDVIPQDARLGHVEHIVVTGLHDAVYFQLTLGELTAYRECAGIVRAVELLVLSAGIAECQTSLLQFVE